MAGKNHKKGSLVPQFKGNVAEPRIEDPIKELERLASVEVGTGVTETRALLDKVVGVHVALAENNGLEPVELLSTDNAELQTGPIGILQNLYIRIVNVLRTNIKGKIDETETIVKEFVDGLATNKNLMAKYVADNKVALIAALDDLSYSLPVLNDVQRAKVQALLDMLHDRKKVSTFVKSLLQLDNCKLVRAMKEQDKISPIVKPFVPEERPKAA